MDMETLWEHVEDWDWAEVLAEELLAEYQSVLCQIEQDLREQDSKEVKSMLKTSQDIKKALFNASVALWAPEW